MKTDPLLINTDGHKELLLGNEAIVRAALESEVAFASGYPGTPSSEITDSFARIADTFGLHFEYSVNEKIALETAFAASLSGARAICAMKHLGLMYAGDPLSTIPYIGAKAGLVIVSAGDPSCRTSPNEQDQRYLGPMLHLPVLDPRSPREAYEMTSFAFELSEQSRLPVLIRITTRVCHTRGVINYGRLSKPKVKGFEKDPKRFVPIPSNARNLRVEIEDRLKIAGRLMAESAFHYIHGKGKLGLLASGSPASICADIIKDRQLENIVSLFTLGTVYPLPKKQVIDFISQMDEVLVVEELSPFLENTILSISAQEGIQVKISGKLSGHFPMPFEYDPELIYKAINRCLGVVSEPIRETEYPATPIRPPILCAGCSHRNSYVAAKAVFGENHLYFNDIGCYTLGYGPPLDTADALLSMGSAFSMASAVSRVTGQKTVAFMGDSTFFHSGMPPLLDAIKEDSDMMAVILDNQVTAMTGFQESPGIEIVDKQPVRDISIEAIARALGAREVITVDPYDISATIEAFRQASQFKGTSVVIAKHPCRIYMSHLQKEETSAYQINDLCINCNLCIDSIGCPAFYLKNDEIKIDPNLCCGCGLCVQICPNSAIEKLE